MAGPSEFIEYSARKVIAARAIAEYADSIYELVATKGITSAQQLKGKVIGISGPNGGDHLWLKAVLQHHDISEKDVTFLTTGNPANRLTALSAGVVQAIAGSSYSRDTSQRIGSILFKANDSPVQVPTGMIIATNQYIGANKPALRRFVKAMGDASQWIRKNPQEAIAICVKGSGATREACAGGIKILADPISGDKYTWSPTFAVNLTGLATALEQVRTTNLEARALKLENLVDPTIAEPLR
jgi:ABC-type nitrate/sulfonate/bicarbonate transport system substrate-binding protein